MTRSSARRARPRTRGPGFQIGRFSPCCRLMSAPPRLFDRALHRRRLDRAASGYGRADFLKARAAADAVDRLEVILRSFPLAVDLGARLGAFKETLSQSGARERV